MELLTSDMMPLQKARTKRRALPDAYLELLDRSDSITAAIGFISSESIVQIHELILQNKRPFLNLFIGMHNFTSVSRKQLSALKKFDSFLMENDLGSIGVSTVLPFHGKIYGFYKERNLHTVIIGSSNLDGLFNSHKYYETDLCITDSPVLSDFSRFFAQDIPRLSTVFSDWEPPAVQEENQLPLTGADGAEKISPQDIERIRSSIDTSKCFRIPLKTHPRSNLNVFFGRGRMSSHTGIVLPRHWYEVEIIVPAEITRMPGYPCLRSFNVFTDDGFSFKCKTSGDYSKNFRSEADLRVLGKWIKGRLENSGALDPGDSVTDEVLERYGRDSISLCATDSPENWFLDFSNTEAKDK